MQIYYITLNNQEEARLIGRALLEQQLAVCVNWFPITCAYRWQGEITEEGEVALIVKTQAGYRVKIEQLISQHISYTNFIAEISPTSINQKFQDWLNAEVPVILFHE
jgi:periplasmic divalent cation tolerance protein